ncbi:hypothetical protein EJ110_NYTH39364 [Nymphaea thermarum]|nr:hypothetical protein EJ110_NYTH39364 [Nymphaea thermarum]
MYLYYPPLLHKGQGHSFESSVLRISNIYGEKIHLKESDRKPTTAGRRGRRRQTLRSPKFDHELLEDNSDAQGPAPWDSSADGCPEFLCDVMATVDQWRSGERATVAEWWSGGAETVAVDRWWWWTG